MKKTLLFSSFFLLLVSCTKDKIPAKLEITESNITVIHLNPGWELNSSFSLIGFVIKEDDTNSLANLIYYINFITPESDTIKSIDYGTATEITDSELDLINIESQIELDKNFIPGEYTVHFIFEDLFSSQRIEQDKKIILSVE